jgi:hypothetical protein
MNTDSTYVHDQLGAWNWSKIGDIVGDVSDTVGNVSGAVQSFAPRSGGGNNIGLTPPNLQTQNQPDAPNNQIQHSNGLLYAAIGAGVFGLIGITAALVK